MRPISLKTVKILSLFLIVLGISACTHPISIFVVGDSTAADKKNPATNPERGWGMVLQGCFDEKVLVKNHAVNGRSSKSFLNEGRWQEVLKDIKPGDYVFIQFGHNDEKPAADRHTDPGTTFDDNLRLYVQQTREKQGIPVLFNAVVRRCFYDHAKMGPDDELLRQTINNEEEPINSDTLIDTHGAYLISPEHVAKEMHVPFVNADKVTHDIETNFGIIGSRKLHMWFTPGEVASIPKGRQDNTHYNVYGAHIMANALADAVAQEVPALRKHVRHYDFVVSHEGRGNYMDLQQAVDDTPFGHKVRILVLGGTWNRPKVPEGKKIRFVKVFGATIR